MKTSEQIKLRLWHVRLALAAIICMSGLMVAIACLFTGLFVPCLVTLVVTAVLGPLPVAGIIQKIRVQE